MAKRRDYQSIYDNTYQRQRRHFWWVVGLFLICVIVGGLGWWQWQAYQRRQLSNYPIQGVMINQDSGYLDFQQLANREKFVYLQATSGATYTDDAYGDNFSRSQGADIAVGVVHTFSFTSSAEQQYRHFRATVKEDSGTLPIMVAVAYCGKYNNDNHQMATQGQKLKMLVQKLTQHYSQGVIILATHQVLDQFVHPVLPALHYWVADGRLTGQGAQVKFIEYDANGTMTQNAQSHAVERAVFNGDRRTWQNFIH